MPNKIRVYFAHAMEGLIIPDESGRRAFEVRKLLGDGFSVLIPEEWQAAVPHTEIQDVDLAKLESADIILADLYHSGCTRNGTIVLARGTNQEVGYAKALNKCRKKKVPIIQIIHSEIAHHPFDREGLVEKNCRSLEEACVYIKKRYDKNNKK